MNLHLQHSGVSSTIQASPSQLYTVTSGPPCRDIADTHLAPGPFLCLGGILEPLLLKQEPHCRSCPVFCCLLRLEPNLIQLPFASAFLHGSSSSLIPSHEFEALLGVVTLFTSFVGRFSFMLAPLSTGLGSVTLMVLLFSSRCTLVNLVLGK